MRITLLCSHKTHPADPLAPWLRQLVRLTQAVVAHGHTLWTSRGTLPYDLSLVTAITWLEQHPGHSQASSCVGGVFGSPSMNSGQDHINEIIKDFKNATLCNIDQEINPQKRDARLIDSSELIVGVSIRANGRLEALLRQKYRTGHPVQILPCDGTTEMRGNQRLQLDGIPLFHPEGLFERWHELMGFEQHHVQTVMGEVIKINEDIYSDRFKEWHQHPFTEPTLTHLTRACNGPWPGQSWWSYLLELVTGGTQARRDVNATLNHILREGILRANGRLIRGHFPMVCFTAQPVAVLLQARRYRKHLRRWDFEPYGLVFRRAALERLGVQPVRYLPEEAWPDLTDAERPFFQKLAPPQCDDRAELEWRWPGELLLDRIDPDDVRILRGPGASIPRASG